jgi:hypothetical protein
MALYVRELINLLGTRTHTGRPGFVANAVGVLVQQREELGRPRLSPHPLPDLEAFAV